jgi:hypothetical protein
VSFPDWLQSRREEAGERLGERPAYGRREANKYTAYRALEQRSSASFEWGATGFELLDYAVAMVRHPERVSARLGGLASGAWADASLAGEYGLVVLHVAESGAPMRLSLRGLGQGFSAPRLLVLSEPGVERALEIELLDDHDDHHLNLVIEVDLAADSSLSFVLLQDQSRNGLTTSTFAARLGKNAKFDGVWLDCGAAMARHDVQIDLAEEGASAHLAGLMLSRPNQHHDQHVHVRHSASNTHSKQIFKGLVATKGRSVFSGCVEVCAGAEGCSADQLSRGLLLGEGAEFDARPQLLISYDAVEASHGSSCGAMDDNALFFLRSRGLDREAAKALLAQGFAGEVLESSATGDFNDRAVAVLQRLVASTST